MVTSSTPQHVPQDTYVLWGEHFDEIATAIFVSAFRQVGLRVRVVGLSGAQSTGIHSLALNTDLTLGEALQLATRALCLVIPCGGAVMRRFENDPRLFQLLDQICVPQTLLVLKEINTFESTTLARLATVSTNRSIYSSCNNLLEYAHHLAQTMASEVWQGNNLVTRKP